MFSHYGELPDNQAKAAPIHSRSRRAETTRRSVWIEGAKLTYLDAGLRDSPVIVLLIHGGETSLASDRLIGALSREYRVVAPDLEGEGGDPLDLNSPAWCHQMNRLVTGLLDHLALDRFLLFSVDLGLLLGWKLLLNGGSRLRGMVLQNGGHMRSWMKAGGGGAHEDGPWTRGQFSNGIAEVQVASLSRIGASTLPVLLILTDRESDEADGVHPYKPALATLEVSIRASGFVSTRDGSTMPHIAAFLARYGSGEAAPDLSL